MIKEEDFDANLAGEDGVTEETKRSWFKRIKKEFLLLPRTRRTLLKAFGPNVHLVNIPVP